MTNSAECEYNTVKNILYGNKHIYINQKIE